MKTTISIKTNMHPKGKRNDQILSKLNCLVFQIEKYFTDDNKESTSNLYCRLY